MVDVMIITEVEGHLVLIQYIITSLQLWYGVQYTTTSIYLRYGMGTIPCSKAVGITQCNVVSMSSFFLSRVKKAFVLNVDFTLGVSKLTLGML